MFPRQAATSSLSRSFIRRHRRRRRCRNSFPSVSAIYWWFFCATSTGRNSSVSNRGIIPVHNNVAAAFSTSSLRPTTSISRQRRDCYFNCYDDNLLLRLYHPNRRSGRSLSSSELKMEEYYHWEDGCTRALEQCILPLTSEGHKGSCGRVAVLGGSERYTGAPYYAAMACLKAGADLAYVFTAQEAALPIKCYSPELMVAPVYSAADFAEASSEQEDPAKAEGLVRNMVDQVTCELPRLHCLVIGPGLGRCPLVLQAVARIVAAARQQYNLFMVFDADALYMLSLPRYRDLLKGYSRAIITPNAMEYKRLFENQNQQQNEKDIGGNDYHDDVGECFSSVVVVQKGAHDVITRGPTTTTTNENENTATVTLTCKEQGGLKRSGGIGDVLAGTIGTLTAWHAIMNNDNNKSNTDALELSCWTACCIVKRATKEAFRSKQRSMTAPDVLKELGPTIQKMMPPNRT